MIKYIQFGIPITIISGGINAVKTVISYCNNPIVPKAHITPIKTTNIEITVALIDLKNKKKISAVTKIAIKTKNFISFKIFSAFNVLT